MEHTLCPQDLDPELLLSFAKRLQITDDNPQYKSSQLHNLIEQMNFQLSLTQKDEDCIGTLHISKRPKITKNNFIDLFLQNIWCFEYGKAVFIITAPELESLDWNPLLNTIFDESHQILRNKMKTHVYKKQPGELKMTPYGGFLLDSVAQSILFGQILKTRHLIWKTIPKPPPEQRQLKAIYATNKEYRDGYGTNLTTIWPFLGVNIVPYGKAFRFSVEYTNLFRMLDGNHVFNEAYLPISNNQIAWKVANHENIYQICHKQINELRLMGANFYP